MVNVKFLEDQLGKMIMALIFIVFAVVALISCSPAHAGDVVAVQGEIDLLQLIAMVWEAKDSLAWYELLILTSFALVPVASIFTSLTPTPKPGTLWSFIYKYIEATAWQFYRSKDKPVDTEVRKLSGKPLNLESTGVQVVGNELKGIVIDTVTQSIPGRIVKALGKLF